MTCEEFVAALMEYLEGKLSPEERAEVEAHMDKYPHCVSYRKSYEQSVTIVRVVCRDEEGATESEPLPENLVQAVLAARRQGEGPTRA